MHKKIKLLLIVITGFIGSVLAQDLDGIWSGDIAGIVTGSHWTLTIKQNSFYLDQRTYSDFVPATCPITHTYIKGTIEKHNNMLIFCGRTMDSTFEEYLTEHTVCVDGSPFMLCDSTEYKFSNDVLYLGGNTFKRISTAITYYKYTGTNHKKNKMNYQIDLSGRKIDNISRSKFSRIKKKTVVY
jgi:hypothetical protein